MASYSDNFNRGSLGTDWTAINGGTWSIASSTYLQQTLSSDYTALRFNNVMGTDNVDVTLRCRIVSGGYGGAGVVVRAPNSGTSLNELDGYGIVFFPNDAFYLVRYDSGDDTGVGYGYSYGNASFDTFYTLRITVSGQTVTGFIDGVQRFQFTDSTYSGSGNRSVAAVSYGSPNNYDDFVASDIVSSQAITSNLLNNSNTFSSYTISNNNAAQNIGVNLLNNNNLIHNLTLTNSTTITPNIANKNRYSIRFNGNGADVNRIRIPLENGTIQYPVNVGANSFTVEAWIKAQYSENTTTATDVRYTNIIYDRDSYGEQRGHVLGLTRNSSKLVLAFGQAGSSGDWQTILSTTNIGDNNWHHIAFTRNISNGLVRLFIDGIQEASGTYDTTNWSFPAGHNVGSGQDNQYLILGCEKHDVGYYFNGEIDELRISNSVKYASTFQPARYNSIDGDTVALFSFDEGSGTSTIDSANSQTGTLLVGGSPSGPIWNTLELSTATLFPVVVTSAFSIYPSVLSSTNTFFTSTFTTGSVGVVFDVLESTQSTFDIVVAAQPVVVLADFIESIDELFDPNVNVGAISVNASFLQNENAFFGYVVSAGGNVLVTDLLNNTNQVFQPTVLPGTVTLISDFVVSESYLLQPTVNQSVFVGFISSEAATQNISVNAGAVSVSPGLIASNAQLFQPAFWADNSVFVDVLNNNVATFTPTITTGVVFFAPDLLASSTQFFQPTFSSGNTILVDLLESEITVFDIAISPGSVTVVLDGETNQNVVYDIFITGNSDTVLDVLVNQNSFFDFAITQNVSTTFIDNQNVIYEISISSQNNIALELIENQSTHYPLTITTGSVIIIPNVIESTLIYEPSFYVGDSKDIFLDFLTSQNVFFTGTLQGFSEERIIRTGVQNRIIVVK